MLSNSDLQEIDKRIKASERRLSKSLEEKLSKSLEEKLSKSLEEKLSKSLGKQFELMLIASEKRIIKDIGEFLADHLSPQIDDKADRHITDRLDNRVDHLVTQVSNHEVRIKKLEDKL